MTIAVIFALIDLGSSTALNAVLSLVIAGFYSSTLIASTVLLVKRITRPSEISWGPFNLGKFGLPINVLAITWTIIGLFFSFWPADAKVTPDNMNWSVLVFGMTLLLSTAFWVLHSKKIYTGPVIETM
jgi:choline transport protein